MAWDSLVFVPDAPESPDNRGTLWSGSANGSTWELFAYSHELPWREDAADRAKKG